MAQEQLPQSTIIYQLEKVDQGGDVADLFERRIVTLADAWGYEIDDETFEIILPDGRRAGLTFEAYVEEKEVEDA